MNAALTSSGGTSLTCASWKGHTGVIRLLCSHGAAVNISTTAVNSIAASPAHATPLMLAARGGHLAAVLALLEHGADKLAVDSAGLTALAHAAEHPQVQAVLRLQ